MNHTKRDEHSNSWNLAKKTVFTISGLLFSSFLMQLPIYAEGQDAVDPNHSVFSPSRLADQCSRIILLIPYFFLYKMNGFAGADYRPPFAPNITDCT